MRYENGTCKVQFGRKKSNKVVIPSFVLLPLRRYAALTQWESYERLERDHNMLESMGPANAKSLFEPTRTIS